MFTDLNIYPTNNKTDHISEKHIFYIKKKVKQKLIFSRLQVGFGSGSGAGSGSVISRNGSEDPDPYQNETDPQHWKNNMLQYILSPKSNCPPILSRFLLSLIQIQEAKTVRIPNKFFQNSFFIFYYMKIVKNKSKWTRIC